MRLITKWEQIKDNLMKLEGYRYSDNKKELDFYTDLIKRGICFIVYEIEGKRIFGPSRFVGYVNNDLDSHLANQEKDGRETNLAINKILGYSPEEDEILEEEYKRFCESLGIEPNKTGPFGVKRKYWFITS